MLKKKTIFGLIVLVGLTAGGVYYFKYPKQVIPEYTAAKAEKQTLVQTVSETGTVKAPTALQLNFLNDGILQKLNVKVGDQVKKDQLLAELDYASWLIKKKEAEASLSSAQTQLQKILAGSTASEIAVSEANVKQGEIVLQNAITELDKTKKTVRENISQAQKTWQDLVKTTEADITTAEQAITVAENNLENTKSTYQKTLDNKIALAKKNLETTLPIINYALDQINRIVTDEDIEDVLSVKDFSALTTAQKSYDQALELFQKTETDFAAYNGGPSETTLSAVLEETLTLLNATFTTLNDTYTVLEQSITSSIFSQTELDTFKSSLNTQLTTISSSLLSIQGIKQDLDTAILAYETNVSSAEKNLQQAQVNLDNATLTAKNAYATAKLSGEQQISVAQGKIDNATAALEIAQKQLAEIKAPARKEDIGLQQAQIEQAQTALESINNNIQNSLLKAPLEGTVTKVEYEMGEKVTPSKAVIELLANQNLEIEVDISESDIAKIELNDKVEITLDAFGDELKFKGHVASIDPAETMIQDVTYYKIKIFFEPESIKTVMIKPGMTANATITTAKKENVLVIPSRAIIDKNGSGKFVRIFRNQSFEELPVTTGLRGDEGLVEILSGLSEGEEIVTYVKN